MIITFIAGLYDVHLLNSQLKGAKKDVKAELSLTDNV